MSYEDLFNPHPGRKVPATELPSWDMGTAKAIHELGLFVSASGDKGADIVADSTENKERKQ